MKFIRNLGKTDFFRIDYVTSEFVRTVICRLHWRRKFSVFEFIRRYQVKIEFGFDTERLKVVSVAKRMSEAFYTSLV